MPYPRVTERTFYPALMEIIRSKGGSCVQEVEYNSVPDIQFKLGNLNWLLSVKLGDDLRTIKSAYLQYLQHKEESGISYGILLLLPESLRRTPATERDVLEAINKTPVTALIDAGLVKEERRDSTFPELINFLIDNVLPRLARHESAYYSLSFVIRVLQQQVAEMMEGIHLDEQTILKIVTDRKLLTDLGNLAPRHAEAVAKFLASYIFLSQVLFLRLLTTARSDIPRLESPSRSLLRRAFAHILNINYRPIYEIDVLDSIPDAFLEDTVRLIQGLEIERVRYELPGRIFHELMPREIRKMLAAFYTRPQAADLLARLAISRSTASVFDPACGSGTILTAAYRRKLQLWTAEGKAGNPHQRFCEEEIFGADIMPFAVHLTSANLAAMDPAILIEKTQIIQADSLRLEPDTYPAGLQISLFPEAPRAQTRKGHIYEVKLEPVDTILMNPPFTKVERGIKRFVDMHRFRARCGGEVGLWGHFIALADAFLKTGGTFGAVLPINVLRGRESARIRKMLFGEWTPLYILKPTRNYGFSEWAEYRDILFIARKEKPQPDHEVKFCLIKKDLTKLSQEDIEYIATKIESSTKLYGDELVDVSSYKLSDVNQHFDNMMWFCGVSDFKHRDLLAQFVDKAAKKLQRFPTNKGYCRTGYRLEGGLAKILFLTRQATDSRVEQAFLRFFNEGKDSVTATSPLGASYKIELDCLKPSLRTPVGVRKMDIHEIFDYVAFRPYQELNRVCSAARVKPPKTQFWEDMQKNLARIETHIAITCRINPFSPDNHLIAFFSPEPFSPSDQLNVIAERDINRARALCLICNSIVFLTQFFLLKEESTGRYVHLRLYDLEEMHLIPSDMSVKVLAQVFDRYTNVEFPALRHQLDQNFDERYEEFWEKERGRRDERLWRVADQPVKPFPARLEMDLDVCKALGLSVNEEDILQLYEVIVKEMIVTRGLRRD